MKQNDELNLRSVKLVNGAECRLVVVQDQLQACPYLEGQIARMPLQLPIGILTLDAMNGLLAGGFRRSGDFVYKTRCAHCNACEPTRVAVKQFRWTTSMRRVLKRGDAALTIRVGPPCSDALRVDLFNLHRVQRNLGRDEEPVDEDGYRSFLVDSCCDTIEISYWFEDRLVAVSIVDEATDALSAVYTYFDPGFSNLSLGTYGILKQFQRAAETGRTYVYLGMYVAENKHLSYKARFLPQHRLVNGHWADIEK